jgi:lysophospholipase L1-like esterase
MTTYLRCFAIAAVVLCACTASAQTARTGRLMREKLQHSQRILQAVTTSDWGTLQRETQALTTITKNPTWAELMTPELRPYADSFQKALAELSKAAERHDYDTAGASYLSLTSACLACHKHVMNSRIAGGR